MTLLNLGSGAHPLAGFDNLDQATGWRFQDGLGRYADGSVEACTASHSLMFLPLDLWPAFLAEVMRVLQPGGILRITEDDAENPESPRYGGFHDAVTLTGPAMLRRELKAAGFKVRKHTATTTGFRDGALLQANHGREPKVCFFEARKP